MPCFALQYPERAKSRNRNPISALQARLYPRQERFQGTSRLDPRDRRVGRNFTDQLFLSHRHSSMPASCIKPGEPLSTSDEQRLESSEVPSLLEAANVSKHYGGVRALKNAHFSLRAGEVHALVGENGAGKSTLARIIAGSTVADTAEIAIDGRRAMIHSPFDAQRLGIGMIYQELDLFPNLTVGENLVIGNLHFREGVLAVPRRIASFCRPFLDRVGLARGVNERVGALPIGQQQLVAIARALSMNARILLMDEPTSSLFDDAAERLFDLIAGLKRAGVAMVYVSHKMDEIFRVCDRATVLRDGETIGTVETQATTSDELIRMMVGRDLTLAARSQAVRGGDVVLTVESLTTDKLRGISFELRSGEVLGVAGLVGAGRSELGAALFGMDRIRGGVVHAHGSIGLLPEDRRVEGLMMNMSVLENSTMAVLSRFQRFGFIRSREELRSWRPGGVEFESESAEIGGDDRLQV